MTEPTDEGVRRALRMLALAHIPKGAPEFELGAARLADELAAIDAELADLAEDFSS